MATDYPNSSAYKLLGILQGYAPDAMAQQVCVSMLWEMQEGGMTNDQITLELAGSLVDGLRHGNWPWEIMKMAGPQIRELKTDGFGDFLKPIAEDTPAIKDQSDRSIDWSEGRE